MATGTSADSETRTARRVSPDEPRLSTLAPNINDGDHKKSTMNNCILMAEIVREPQLRYTADNQLPIAEMLIQFTTSRPNDPPATLRVIGWGNLAEEMNQKYHVGDSVVIEGRLQMNVMERPEGFKEKRAELVARRIYPLGASPGTGGEDAELPATPPSNVVPLGSRNRTTPSPQTSGSDLDADESHRPTAPSQPSPDPEDPDYDPIPF
ncbi:single-stranded DNA-binding protein [Lyngbya sp. CCY1209]|uniref:single-stranded DNA-binding protein n=1 Tax=Lyngbya sp. CCY1209 TaxID=2886103 RepID=UPI002D20DDDF|nr:single-stranded DNA-binding protein [Lyngbya sp. CCY1209]MEB3882722.1 single-stranded DNA-binding protein [Lyngbya sp. CCY1209]